MLTVLRLKQNPEMRASSNERAKLSLYVAISSSDLISSSFESPDPPNAINRTQARIKAVPIPSINEI